MKHSLLARVLRHAALPLVLGATPALAQQASDGKTVYEPAFFAAFAPATAEDMVRHVPGFSIQNGDSALRGFGQAAGNVLVNGQRPASKSDGLATMLSRIPAKRVVRIELASGERFGADFAGKPQVVNVVVSGGGLSGLAQASATRFFTGRVVPGGKLSVTGTRGPSTFTAAVNSSINNYPVEGFDRVSALPGGALIEYRKKDQDYRDHGIQASAGWAYEAGRYRSAHVNAKAIVKGQIFAQQSAVATASDTRRDDRLGERYRKSQFELGGDVSRPLAGGGIKLVALATRGHVSDHQLARTDIDSPLRAAIDDSRYRSEAGESLLRLSWSRENIHGWAVELGAEGARNRFDFTSRYRTGREGGPLIEEAADVQQARISENRGEIFVSAGRKLAPGLRGDFALTQEFSELEVAAPAGGGESGSDPAPRTRARTLRFLKPKAALDWQPGGAWRVRASAERTVNQLDFLDFVSTVSLGSGQSNGGNVRLEPQRAWEMRVSAEHALLGTGLARVELGYNAIEKVQDRIPVRRGYDAPGNLGAGHALIIDSSLDLPLTGIGLKGGRMTARSVIWDMHVRDPYTGRDRPFSNYSRAVISLAVRQDVGKFSWALTLNANSPSTNYRLNETDFYYQGFQDSSLELTYRPDKATTVVFEVENVLGVVSERRRTFYAPDRSSADPVQFEYRQRRLHFVPSLTVRRTFG